MNKKDLCGLLRRCLEGRKGRDWQELIQQYGDEVRRTLRQTAIRCGLPLDRSDLDELVQDFYCRLLATRGRQFVGRTEQEFSRYLARVAQSLVIDQVRRMNASKRQPIARGRSLNSVRWRSLKLNPEERLIRKECRRALLRRCLTIVHGDRVQVELQALGLAVLEGWASRDIARALQDRLSPARVDRLVCMLRRLLLSEGIHMPRRTSIRPAPAG